MKPASCPEQFPVGLSHGGAHMFDASEIHHFFAGSSGGALVAGWVCCKTDTELSREIRPDAIQLGPFEELRIGMCPYSQTYFELEI